MEKLPFKTTVKTSVHCRNCPFRPHLGAAKPSLKQRVVFETRVNIPKSTLFFSSNWKWKAFSKQPQHTCSCMYTLISYTSPVVQSLHKRCFKVHKVHVYSTVVLYCEWKSGGRWFPRNTETFLYIVETGFYNHPAFGAAKISIKKAGGLWDKGR